MDIINRRQALKRIAILTGGALSMSTVAGVLGGCRAQTGVAWEPVALSSEQAVRLEHLVDLIIPATDTPGAREAGVPEFIDRMLAEWYATAEREHFLEGLDAVEAGAREQYGESFVDLDDQQQAALLRRVAEESETAEVEEIEVEARRAWQDPHFPGREPLPGTGEQEVLRIRLQPFFRVLKELTLVGYYTSEIGGTQELQYVHTPGRYDGCMPLEEYGRAWV